MAFHEIDFPRKIALGSTGGPVFSTSVIETFGGYEQRNQRWTYPRHEYDVSQALKDLADTEELRAFFMARQGKTHGFRFRDHRDYKAVQEATDPAVGDGVETEFQLQKTYSDGGGSRVRKIVKPVHGTTRIYVSGVLQANGWTIDETTGIVTFDAAPTGPVTATFWFDVPVRFDTDSMPTEIVIHGENLMRQSWNAIRLVEVRE